MKRKEIDLHIKNIMLIMLGSMFYSLGITYFAIPNKLAEGGFTGIAVILYYLFQLPTGWVVLLLNIPLFLVGYKVFGKKSFIYTLIGTFAVSVFLEITPMFGGFVTDDLLFVALYTGVMTGIGLGIILRVGATTGGVDIIARLTNKYWSWSMGRTFLVFDFTIISISAFFFGLEVAMYTLVSVFVNSRVVDFVVEGLSQSKAAMIISQKSELVAKEITKGMNRGVTILNGKGGFTGQDKEVIYVAFAPTELPKLKHLVTKNDPYAFMVVYDVRDVHGEGFSFHSKERGQ